MNEKKFLKTLSRVKDILTRKPFAREDDIYLTWQLWAELVPDLEKLTMRQFKYFFLSGALGLPASATRARAHIQNKTNPELKGIAWGARRPERADIWTTWFAQNKAVALDAELEIINLDVNLEANIAAAQLTPADMEFVNFKPIEIMKKSKLFTGELYHTLGEYLALYNPRQAAQVTPELAKEILTAAKELNRVNKIPVKYKTGTGAREGLRIEVYRHSILQSAVNSKLEIK